MGSVIDYIECPHCGQEAYDDFYYKTGEEYVNCQNCGYHYSATYKRDDKGEFVTKDGTDDYSFENLIMETKELKIPYGAFRIKYVDSIGYHCGSLENEKDYIELTTSADLNENGAMEFMSVSRYVNGETIQEVLLDNGPKVDGAGFTEEDREELPL
jgi:hypothetical protein